MKWSPIMFLDIYLPEDFSSNHNGAYLTITYPLPDHYLKKTLKRLLKDHHTFKDNMSLITELCWPYTKQLFKQLYMVQRQGILQ